MDGWGGTIVGQTTLKGKITELEISRNDSTQGALHF
jgi:hypothetical protein